MRGQTPATQSSVRPGNKDRGRSARLPLVIYVLAVGTFLMLTTEFVVAGILPQVPDDFQIGVAQAGAVLPTKPPTQTTGESCLPSMLTLPPLLPGT